MADFYLENSDKILLKKHGKFLFRSDFLLKTKQIFIWKNADLVVL